MPEMFDVEQEVSANTKGPRTMALNAALRILRRAARRFGLLKLGLIGQEYLPISHPRTASGSVPSVVSVTCNFQSETRLHEGARMALPHIFDQAWPDPKKVSDDAKSAAILQNEAKETFAAHLGVRSDEIHFLGESNLGFHLGIMGLMQPDFRFNFAATDRMANYAISDSFQKSGYRVRKVSVTNSGQLDFAGEPIGAGDLLSLQLCNRETGIIQNKIDYETSALFVDATASGTRIKLPANWSVALFDSRSWMGPAGVGILAISKRAIWTNPLPHLDTKVSPGQVSLPLVVTSAVAIDSWVADEKNLAAKIAELKRILVAGISRIPDSYVITEGADHLVNATFEGVDSEYLVNNLIEAGFAVDSGSACSPANIKPSHVLDAMGLATTGNIRLTIHHATSFEEVTKFLEVLSAIIDKLRS
jgi:cysteine desulfurase